MAPTRCASCSAADNALQPRRRPRPARRSRRRRRPRAADPSGSSPANGASSASSSTGPVCVEKPWSEVTQMLNRSRRPAERSRAWMRSSSASTARRAATDAGCPMPWACAVVSGVAEPEDGHRLDRRAPAPRRRAARRRRSGCGRGWARRPAAADRAARAPPRQLRRQRVVVVDDAAAGDRVVEQIGRAAGAGAGDEQAQPGVLQAARRGWSPSAAARPRRSRSAAGCPLARAQEARVVDRPERRRSCPAGRASRGRRPVAMDAAFTRRHGRVDRVVIREDDAARAEQRGRFGISSGVT